jgi:hypothetical protein
MNLGQVLPKINRLRETAQIQRLPTANSPQSCKLAARFEPTFQIWKCRARLGHFYSVTFYWGTFYWGTFYWGSFYWGTFIQVEAHLNVANRQKGDKLLRQ